MAGSPGNFEFNTNVGLRGISDLSLYYNLGRKRLGYKEQYQFARKSFAVIHLHKTIINRPCQARMRINFFPKSLKTHAFSIGTAFGFFLSLCYSLVLTHRLQQPLKVSSVRQPFLRSRRWVERRRHVFANPELLQISLCTLFLSSSTSLSFSLD